MWAQGTFCEKVLWGEKTQNVTKFRGYHHLKGACSLLYCVLISLVFSLIVNNSYG